MSYECAWLQAPLASKVIAGNGYEARQGSRVFDVFISFFFTLTVHKKVLVGFCSFCNNLCSSL